MLRTVLVFTALCALALASRRNEAPPPPPPEEPPAPPSEKKSLLMGMATDSKTNSNSKKELQKKFNEVMSVLKSRREMDEKIKKLKSLRSATSSNEEDNGNLEKKLFGDDHNNFFELLFNAYATNLMLEELLYFDYFYYLIGYGSGMRWSLDHSLNAFDYVVETNENRTAT